MTGASTKLQNASGHPWAAGLRAPRAVGEALVERPACTEDVVAAVQRAARLGQPVRALGARHSCSDLVGSRGMTIDMRVMDALVSFAPDRSTVTVQAGMSLAALHHHLAGAGLCLPVAPTTGAPTIGGALATGTHGSGRSDGELAGRLTALQVVGADGQVSQVTERDALVFDAYRVHLGALGIVVQATLRCESAYSLTVERTVVSLAATARSLAADHADSDHLTVWWFPHTGRCVRWRAWRTERRPSESALAPTTTLGRLAKVGHGAEMEMINRWPALSGLASAAALARHARRRTRLSAAGCPARAAIAHPQLVMEYAIPEAAAPEALRALARSLSAHRHRAHYPIEVRFGPAERGWLSPAYQRRSCYLGMVAYQPGRPAAAALEFFRDADTVLRRFDGRPHWAKVGELSRSRLETMYPRFADFASLVHNVDPDGRFANQLLEDLFR